MVSIMHCPATLTALTTLSVGDMTEKSDVNQTDSRTQHVLQQNRNVS